MSASVDERILGMRFDNAQFEQGTKKTLDSIAKLKKGLNFGNAAKGLSDVSVASRGISFDGIANGVDSLVNRFSNLGIVGITALQNITNSAVNAGIRMGKALTIDPVMTGFSEYETKMGSIQTILTNTASKGTTLTDVTAALDELNTYADKTIYNFAEMTRNIGTFTAAGVDLETSKTAIKGIANLAAASGSNAQQASTAMYQLSQALASGSVKLMDWNSVVNAGMGGELFKNALQDTAREMGTDVDAIIKKSGSFRESLQEGWITADVLNTTLKKMTKEGAAEYGQAMLKSGKYTQEQVDALMKQASMAENAATEVKTLTQMFSTMKESVQSGWAQSWESIIGDKEEATKVLTAINDAFGNLIGPSTDARNAMLAFWNENGGRDALISALGNAFKFLGSILKPISEAFKEVFPPMTGEKLVEISNRILEISKSFKLSKGAADAIKKTFKGLFSVVSILGKVLQSFVQVALSVGQVLLPISGILLGITSAIGNFIISLNQSIASSNVFGKIVDQFTKILEPLSTMFDGTSKLGPIFEGLADSVIGVLSRITKAVNDGLNTFNFENLFHLINGGLLAGILLGIGKFVASMELLGQKVAEGGFLSNITSIFDGVKGCLKGYQNDLNAKALMKIAIAIGILAASLVAVSLIDPERLASALAGITILFVELFAALAVFQKITMGKGMMAMAKLTTEMLALSTSILLLSFAMERLGKLKWNEIAKGLVAIAGLAAVMVGSSKLLAQSKKGMIKGSVGFIALAGALLILTTAMEKIAKLDIKQIGKGLLGIGVLLAELSLFMKLTDMSGISLKSYAGLVLMAGAIAILSNAVEKLGIMKPKQLAQGLLAIGAILTELMVFLNLTGSPEKFIATSTGLILLATAVNIFALAIQSLGGMKPEALVQGLLALAGALAIITVAMNFMKTTIAGSAAMLILAGALAILAPVLAILGNMSLVQIGKSLLALVGVFAVLGGAAALLTPVIPSLLGLAGALTLLGVACTLIGGGLLMVSAGLTALAVTGAAGVGSLVVIISSIVGTIPAIIKSIGIGFVELIKVVGKAAPTIATALGNIVTAMLTMLVTKIPQFVTLIMSFVSQMVAAFTSAIPYLAAAGINMIVSLLNGLAIGIPRIVESATNIIVNFLYALGQATPRIVDAAFQFVLTFIQGLTDSIDKYSEQITTALIDLGKAMIKGLIKGLTGGVVDVVKTIASLGKTIIAALKKVLGIKSPSREFAKIGVFANQGLIVGLNQMKGKVVKSAYSVGDEAKTALNEAIANMAKIDSDMSLQPTIKPVLDMKSVNKGLSNTFGKNQTISVAASRTKAAEIATSRAKQETITKLIQPIVNQKTENHYNTTVNNPKPEPASTSVRTTLLKQSYAIA